MRVTPKPNRYRDQVADLVVAAFTAVTMLLVGALVLAPVVWLVLRLYGWIL